GEGGQGVRSTRDTTMQAAPAAPARLRIWARTRMPRGEWLTAANGATLARVAAIPLILVLLAVPTAPAQASAAALFLAAALTDVLDGHLARRRATASPLGALLDLTADKLLVVTVLIDLTSRQLVPAWVVIVIVARELLVSGVRSYAGLKGAMLPAQWMGKLKMAATSAAITAAILEVPIASGLLGAAAALTVVSAGPYLMAGLTPWGPGDAAADRTTQHLSYNRHLRCVTSFGGPCRERPAGQTPTRPSRTICGCAARAAGS
ncbi:MAG: CDP-diacylglycerol--glycerol-3-phosphate 3-phosphatidyltransferase, partial [Chloroflexota bacterium]